MCAEHSTKAKRQISSATLYLIAVVLGLISGYSDIAILQNLGLFISDVFIKIFKCISMPIIALSLIVTLSQYHSEGKMRKIWQRALLYTISTTIVAASIACALYQIIQPTNIGTRIGPIIQQETLNSNYFAHLANLIPSNIFAPFLEHQVIGVLLVGALIGIAIRSIKDELARQTIGNFFKGAHGLFLVITGWVVKVIPIGLFGFITTTIIQLKGGTNIGGLGGYLAVVVLANLIQGFVILPIWLKSNKIAPYTAMKGMLPALSVAFFTKSSAGTLPLTIKTAEKNLNINPKIGHFVLPLCTTINMNGCAAFIFATVIYLMQNNGIVIDGWTMIGWIIVATIAAVGNAGVPMGCFFLSASLLSSMNVPITLLGIILPFYSIIDMIETALNVWSDSCVAKVVDEKAKHEMLIE